MEVFTMKDYINLLLIISAVALVISIIILIVRSQRRPLYQFSYGKDEEIAPQQRRRWGLHINLNFSLPKIKINLLIFQTITAAVAALTFLLIAAIKEAGSPWLMLSGLFFLIYLVLQRINSFRRRYRRRKMSKILKMVFGYSFWLLGFIFLTILWVIFFII